MKRFFQFLMASALVVSMQGCSNEPSDEISSAVELKLKGEIQTPMSGTRVNANGFEPGDAFGLYVVNYEDSNQLPYCIWLCQEFCRQL